MSETKHRLIALRFPDDLPEEEPLVIVQQALLDQAREALRALYDEQNDAPLENRRAQWKSAMRKAEQALAAMEEQP